MGCADGTSGGPSLPHNAPIWHAAFSKDSRRLLTKTHGPRPGNPSPEQFVRVWEVASGRLLTPPLAGGLGPRYFMLDDEFVLTRSGATTLQLWHAQTGKPAGGPLEHPANLGLHLENRPGRPIRGDRYHSEWAGGLTNSQNRTTLRPSSGCGICARARRQLCRWFRRSPFGPPVHPDGTRLVYNDPDDVANVLDVRTGKHLAAYPPQRANSGTRSPPITVMFSRGRTISMCLRELGTWPPVEPPHHRSNTTTSSTRKGTRGRIQPMRCSVRTVDGCSPRCRTSRPAASCGTQAPASAWTIAQA